MSDTTVMSADVKFEGQHQTHFRPATQDEVHNEVSIKVLWTWPMTNESAEESARMSAAYEKALVRPLIKKPNLDKEVPENY